MISAIVVIIGAILFVPFAVYDAITFHFSTITGRDVILILYSAVVVTVMAVLLMNQAVKELAGGSTAVFTTFMPLSAISVSFFFLGETILWYHVIGITCVLFSVILVSFKQKQRAGLVE